MLGRREAKVCLGNLPLTTIPLISGPQYIFSFTTASKRDVHTCHLPKKDTSEVVFSDLAKIHKIALILKENFSWALNKNDVKVNCPHLYFLYLNFYNSFYFSLDMSLFFLLTLIYSIHSIYKLSDNFSVLNFLFISVKLESELIF